MIARLLSVRMRRRPLRCVLWCCTIAVVGLTSFPGDAISGVFYRLQGLIDAPTSPIPGLDGSFVDGNIELTNAAFDDRSAAVTPNEIAGGNGEIPRVKVTYGSGFGASGQVDFDFVLSDLFLSDSSTGQRVVGLRRDPPGGGFFDPPDPELDETHFLLLDGPGNRISEFRSVVNDRLLDPLRLVIEAAVSEGVISVGSTAAGDVIDGWVFERDPSGDPAFEPIFEPKWLVISARGAYGLDENFDDILAVPIEGVPFAWVRVVPEPASIMPFIIGLLGLGVVKRRRNAAE